MTDNAQPQPEAQSQVWPKETFKSMAVKAGLTVLASIIVGIISAALTGWYMLHDMAGRVDTLEHNVIGQRLVERTGSLETQIERHEKAIDRDYARHEQTVLALGVKTDDQEKRLTRLETLVGETQALLSEIRADVKILLRGGQQ